MRRSQSFASAPTDSGALFRLAFAPARGIYALNLASEEQLVGSLCKRHAVTSRLPQLAGARFQVLFHSAARGAFHLSLTVLVHYRSPGSV